MLAPCFVSQLLPQQWLWGSHIRMWTNAHTQWRMKKMGPGLRGVSPRLLQDGGGRGDPGCSCNLASAGCSCMRNGRRASLSQLWRSHPKMAVMTVTECNFAILSRGCEQFMASRSQMALARHCMHAHTHTHSPHTFCSTLMAVCIIQPSHSDQREYLRRAKDQHEEAPQSLFHEKASLPSRYWRVQLQNEGFWSPVANKWMYSWAFLWEPVILDCRRNGGLIPGNKIQPEMFNLH